MSIISCGKRKLVETTVAEESAETAAEGAGSSSAAPAASTGRRKKTEQTGQRFQKELRSMMFGFGDSAKPLPQSTELMEDLVVDYLHQMLAKVHAFA